jgi:predicted alpha/beta superfamily hydrolase
VVVGVGYPTTDLGEVSVRRQRDATPTAAAFPEGGNFGSRAGALGTGGADRLRAFLVEELRPWLTDRYRLRAPWVLVGHSMTALFGVHTLVTEPRAFDAYLFASPSLWWDDRVMLRDSALTRPGPQLAADVYVSAGGDEDRPGSNFAMEANARRLAELVEPRVAAAGHRLTFEVIDGETHHSTTGAAVSRGLRALLGTPG